MDNDDRPEPRWSTTSPAELDRLAHGVLRAARDAARELRRSPEDPHKQTWALGVLAGHVRAMLGPDEPCPPPTGVAEQEEFVRTALTLAVHVRARSWAQADLGVKSPSDVPHPGEQQAADALDVLGRLMLPHASPEGWTATLVTDWARGSETLEAAVKLGKYILHPTFLTFVDDLTRMLGKAMHKSNVDRLHKLADQLRACVGDLAEPLAIPVEDPLAALLEDLDATPVDGQQATVQKPREKRQLDVLSDDEEERPRRSPYGRISAEELKSPQKFEQGTELGSFVWICRSLGRFAVD